MSTNISHEQTERSAPIDFARLLRGRVCVVGIGNRDRGDDAAGSVLAGSLAGACAATVIDAGAVPENYLGKVVRKAPDTVVLVDAVDFGAPVGSFACLSRDRFRDAGLSTHALSLGMAVDYLSRACAATVVVIGIQPQQLDAGAGMTRAVERGIASLREQLLGALRAGSEERQHENR